MSLTRSQGPVSTREKLEWLDSRRRYVLKRTQALCCVASAKAVGSMALRSFQLVPHPVTHRVPFGLRHDTTGTHHCPEPAGTAGP